MSPSLGNSHHCGLPSRLHAASNPLSSGSPGTRHLVQLALAFLFFFPHTGQLSDSRVWRGSWSAGGGEKARQAGRKPGSAGLKAPRLARIARRSENQRQHLLTAVDQMISRAPLRMFCLGWEPVEPLSHFTLEKKMWFNGFFSRSPAMHAETMPVLPTTQQMGMEPAP